MSDLVAPESPLVTYPPDAARPRYNYRDYYPDSPDPIYVPVPGDEGSVDQMTELEIAERSELSSAAQYTYTYTDCRLYFENVVHHYTNLLRISVAYTYTLRM
jgi:hypothetical protein